MLLAIVSKEISGLLFINNTNIDNFCVRNHPKEVFPSSFVVSNFEFLFSVPATKVSVQVASIPDYSNIEWFEVVPIITYFGKQLPTLDN